MVNSYGQLVSLAKLLSYGYASFSKNGDRLSDRVNVGAYMWRDSGQLIALVTDLNGFRSFSFQIMIQTDRISIENTADFTIRSKQTIGPILNRNVKATASMVTILLITMVIVTNIQRKINMKINNPHADDFVFDVSEARILDFVSPNMFLSLSGPC